MNQYHIPKGQKYIQRKSTETPPPVLLQRCHQRSSSQQQRKQSWIPCSANSTLNSGSHQIGQPPSDEFTETYMVPGIEQTSIT